MTSTTAQSGARTDARGSARLPRGHRTVAAVIAATLLLVVAGLVAWQAILVQAGRGTYGFSGSAVADRLRQTSWNAPGVTITAVVIAALGVWLLALGLLPAPRQYTQLREAHPEVVTGISKKNICRALDSAAERVDGVSSAHTRLRRRTAMTTLTSPLGNPAGLTQSAQAAITQRLQQLDPLEPITGRVRLRRNRRR